MSNAATRRRRPEISSTAAIARSMADFGWQGPPEGLTAEDVRKIVCAKWRSDSDMLGTRARGGCFKEDAQRAVGRPLGGFPLAVALALLRGHVDSGLSASAVELRATSDIFRDVARFARLRRAYRAAMEADGWFLRDESERGNVGPLFFARRTRRLCQKVDFEPRSSERKL